MKSVFTVKNIAAFLAVLAPAPYASAYTPCPASVDLSKAMIRGCNFQDAATEAGDRMRSGADAVFICRAGDNLALVTSWEIVSGPGAGNTTDSVELFTK